MYSYVWKPEEGLKYIDDEKFNLAKLLAESGVVEVDRELFYVQDDAGNIISDGMVRFFLRSIKCFGMNGDGSVTTDCSMRHYMDTNTVTMAGNDTYFWQPVDSIRLKNCFQNCGNCIYCDGCVYGYAAYIRYLLDEGRVDIMEADRQYYAAHKEQIDRESSSPFAFELADNLFLDLSDEYLEVAELLQKHGGVSLFPHMYTDNEGARWQINTILAHTDINNYQDLSRVKKTILNNQLSWSKMECLNVLAFDSTSAYKTYLLELYAGYIDYLKKTGKFEVYKAKRQAHIKKTTEEFEAYCNTVPGMKKVLAVAETDTESSLYYIIEGERGVGKQDLIKNIARYLNQNGMIHSSDYTCMTFEELAVSFGYKQRDYGENDYRNQYMRYSGFESHKLYVLTDLKEFVYAAMNSSEGDGEKYSHLIKLLGRYQPDTYIIIVGEKKYVDRFLKLSPSIQFNFGRNIVHLDNLSTEKLYAAYAGKLSENLRKQLQHNEEFKRSFENYLEKNRRAMPLENQELASYLANYANLHKKLILPPYAYQSKTADEMLGSVIGMNNVKKTVEEFKKYAVFMKKAAEDGVSIPNSNMHMIFTGNPGTGKTMIARIVGQLLYDLELITENKVIEIEPREFKTAYIGESAKKIAEFVDKAMGGVLFIDEAYAIGSDDCGKEAIASLIKAMEDYKDKFVVIFAGYEKEMHEFMNINSGIASRIGYTFKFEDYSPEELVEIFDVKMKNAGFTYGKEVLDAVAEITAHFSGKKNFGNGRFVDKIIQRTLLKHAMALGDNGDVKEIAALEVPSVEEMISTDVIEHHNFEEELNNFIGLTNVKAKVRQFAKFVEFQQKARKKGAVIPAGNMHMVFTGNPGTGKTTIARVMVDLLYDIDVIKERKLIEVERKDLVAEYIGQTAQKTNEVIERALNGVLFVDEAYSLAADSKNDFGGEAIATLIKAMEDHKDELIVIFAGYKDEMRSFLKMNPGIESRIGNTFDFEDYSVDELLEIYLLRMKKAGFEVTEKAKEKAKNVFSYFSRKPNFGNGRFVARLQQETFVKHAARLNGEEELLLIIDGEDIPEISDLNNTAREISATDELSKIIGMESVKRRLAEFEDMVNFSVQAREHGIKIPNLNFHMLFTGNPGTGKTTIARIITKKLFDIGLIMENKLVETERKDLVAGYIGQTAVKTAEMLEKAMGGVLFIDEAYTLTPKSENDFGGEAIATLIKAMEDHKEDLIVIFAGYKDEMAEFVDSNPGIASRIGFTFQFEDYTPEQLAEIYIRKMIGCGFAVTEGVEEELTKLMSVFSKKKNFGNGRFVDKVIQQTILKHARRHLTENIGLIDVCDIPKDKELSETMQPEEVESPKIGFRV